MALSRPPAACVARDCDNPADDLIGDYSEPYTVPLGNPMTADTQLIVFDSSLAGLAPLTPDDVMYRNYRGQLERAWMQLSRRASNFFIAHHPVLGFAPNARNPNAPYPGNRGLQSVLQTLQPDTLFPPGVQAVLGGHIHLFEVVSFATSHPPQIISGNAGDYVDPRFPSPFSPGAMPAPGAVVERTVSSDAFGFMTMEREGANWKLTARDTRGTALTTCVLADKKIGCAPSSGL